MSKPGRNEGAAAANTFPSHPVDMRCLDEGFTIATDMRRRILDDDPHNVDGCGFHPKTFEAKRAEKVKSRRRFFPHPTNTKPIKIGTSTFIA